MKLRATIGLTLMLFLNSVTYLADSKVTPPTQEKSYAEGRISQHYSFPGDHLCLNNIKSDKKKI